MTNICSIFNLSDKILKYWTLYVKGMRMRQKKEIKILIKSGFSSTSCDQMDSFETEESTKEALSQFNRIRDF